ncbi:MAG TPA: hypothetical protein VIV11_10055 [Kofleriaceae bacterium]
MRGVIVAILLAACGDDASSIPAEANPLGLQNNILPYPSSLYEVPDGAGVRLDVPPGAFPANTVTNTPFDPVPLAKRRGWPASTTILWAVPGGADPAGFVTHRAIADSLTDASATVLFDMTSGERVAHFAEVDVNELDIFDHQAVYIRPAARLAGGHRYAVGIRKSLRARDGSELPASEGFRAVLADRNLGHARLDAARPRLREAIAALEAAGIPRDDLVVAWDFTVEPDEAALADPVAARDAALAAMGPLGANLTYTVTSDLGTINSDPRLARRIELDFESPAVTGEAHAGFHRDGNGTVVAMGTMTAKAYVMIPACATFNNKAGLLIYGHGIFGGLPELRNGEYARDLAADGCMIVAGTTWTGMSNDDIPNALLALNDLNKGWGFGERIFQGIVNTIALEQLLRGKLATELFVDSQARSIVDPSRMSFLGVSMGHVLGSTFVAYDPIIARGVLHVGGANWALMFERSNSWAAYGLPIKSTYDTLLDAVIMEQVLQMALQVVDGATVAGIAVPGTPVKQLLLQTSLDDASVPNVASFYHARSIGAELLSTSVVTPFGFAPAVESSATRALVVVDEKPPRKPPETNEVFSFDSIAHEHPRRRTLLQAQMRSFWSTGTISNTCTGPCDCAAGACGDLRTAMFGGS